MKTLKIKLKVKTKDESKLPDWGLGKGILAEREIELLEEATEKNKVRLRLAIQDIYNDLIEDTLEMILE